MDVTSLSNAELPVPGAISRVVALAIAAVTPKCAKNITLYSIITLEYKARTR